VKARIEGFAADTAGGHGAFASGRRESFPLDTLLSRFKALDSNDLRAMKLQNMATLRMEAEKDPSALLRRCATLYRGTITSLQVKNELCARGRRGEGMADVLEAREGGRRRRILGSRSRVRRPGPRSCSATSPVGLVDEATTSLQHQNDLGQRIGVLRDYLARGQDADCHKQILDLATKTVEQAIEEKKATHAHILDGILFLEEHGLRASVPAAQEVLKALLVRGPTVRCTRRRSTASRRRHRANTPSNCCRRRSARTGPTSARSR
jgi:hypothetical protein